MLPQLFMKITKIALNNYQIKIIVDAVKYESVFKDDLFTMNLDGFPVLFAVCCEPGQTTKCVN